MSTMVYFYTMSEVSVMHGNNDTLIRGHIGQKVKGRDGLCGLFLFVTSSGCIYISGKVRQAKGI